MKRIIILVFLFAGSGNILSAQNEMHPHVSLDMKNENGLINGFFRELEISAR